MTSKRQSRRTVRARHRIDVVVEPRAAAIWRRTSATIVPRVRRAAAAALAAAPVSRGGAKLAVYLADDAVVRRLNREFRNKNRSTNVLSFPAGPMPMVSGPAPLGDIVLAYETLAREASQQGKKLLHHVLHLVVHGVLHLVGYDHEKTRDAERMEAMEVRILAGLGIADPYALPEVVA